MATLISGNTYPVREKLRALGGTWMPEEKSWSVPDEKAALAKALVAAAPRQTFHRTKCVACGRVPTGRYGDTCCGVVSAAIATESGRWGD